MTTEGPNERLIRYLNDCWTVEKTLVSALQDQAARAQDPSLQAMFTEHSAQTHQQEELLEERIRALGSEPARMTGFLTRMLAKLGEALHQPADDFDEDTQLVMKSYAIEHFEMAMYRSLETFARAVGDAPTAELAKAIFAQERDTAEKLWGVLPAIAEKAARVAVQS